MNPRRSIAEPGTRGGSTIGDEAERVMWRWLRGASTTCRLSR
jgi:hypothetical protein